MNTPFYRLWLPVSLAAHLLVLLLLNVIPLAVTPIDGDNVIPISVVQAAEPPKPTPPPVQPTPPAPRPAPERVAPPPQPTRRIPQAMGEPDAHHATGAVRGNAEGKLTGVKAPADPAGKHRTPSAPPDVMRSPTGRGFSAPPGVNGGVGTQGTNPIPSGPSYGARARSGPHEGTDKLAGEINLSAVARFTVTLDATGAALAVHMTQGTGNDYLDGVANMKIRKWSFTPAMKDGAPIKGSVQMKVEFHNGDYTIEEVKE